MKYILAAAAALVMCPAVLPQSARDEPRRYTYHVWGTVLDEGSRARPGTNVCFYPAERPIGGRIPCVKADGAGQFALTTSDVPDKYKVCALTTDWPFILERDGDEGHRAACSEVITFGAGDECRRVELKFE